MPNEPYPNRRSMRAALQQELHEALHALQTDGERGGTASTERRVLSTIIARNLALAIEALRPDDAGR